MSKLPRCPGCGKRVGRQEEQVVLRRGGLIAELYFHSGCAGLAAAMVEENISMVEAASKKMAAAAVSASVPVTSVASLDAVTSVPGGGIPGGASALSGSTTVRYGDAHVNIPIAFHQAASIEQQRAIAIAEVNRAFDRMRRNASSYTPSAGGVV